MTTKERIITYILCFIALSLLAYGLSTLFQRLSEPGLTNTRLVLVILAAAPMTAFLYITLQIPQFMFFIIFLHTLLVIWITQYTAFVVFYMPPAIMIMSATANITQD